MTIDYLESSEPTINFQIAPKTEEYNPFGQEIFILNIYMTFKNFIKEFNTNKCYCINGHKTTELRFEPLDKDSVGTIINYIKYFSFYHTRIKKSYNASALTFGCTINTTGYHVKQHKYFNLPEKNAQDSIFQRIIFVPSIFDKKVEVFLELYDEYLDDKMKNYSLNLINDNVLENGIIDISNNENNENARSFKIAEISFKNMKKYFLPRFKKYYNLLNK